MQTLDEKKVAILPLLDSLRKFNPEIGNYEKSILNESFQYAVKLTNGKLVIPQEVVYDFEQSPAFVTEEQLKYAAATFVPIHVTISYQTTPKAAIREEKAISEPQIHSVQPKQSNPTLKRVLILGAIIVLALIGYSVFAHIAKEQQTSEVENDKNRIRNYILSYVTAETNQYQYSELGGIYNLVISINNNTDYIIENVRVQVTYIKANGGVWRNKDIDFEMLSPQSIGTIKVPDTDRGVSVRCRIISIKSTALGL